MDRFDPNRGHPRGALTYEEAISMTDILDELRNRNHAWVAFTVHHQPTNTWMVTIETPNDMHLPILQDYPSEQEAIRGAEFFGFTVVPLSHQHLL